MAMNKELAVLALIGGAAAIAALVVSNLEKEGVNLEIEKARNELFEIAPGCESITFKGMGDGGAPDPERLELAERYYFLPFVRANLTEAAKAEAELMELSIAELLTGRMLYQLFPECKEKAPWPPASLFTAGMFGVIWVAMKIYMAGLIETVSAAKAEA
jgi:hypothetical protein